MSQKELRQRRWQTLCNQRAATTIYTRRTASRTAALTSLLTPTQKFQVNATVLAPWLAKRRLPKGQGNTRLWQEKKKKKSWGRRRKDEIFLRFILLHYNPKTYSVLPSPVATYPLIWIIALKISLFPAASMLIRVGRQNTCVATWGCCAILYRRKGFAKEATVFKEKCKVWKQSWM